MKSFQALLFGGELRRMIWDDDNREFSVWFLAVMLLCIGQDFELYTTFDPLTDKVSQS